MTCLRRLLLPGVFLVGLVLLGGCGSPKQVELSTVTGKVTYQGKVLPAGMVVFLGPEKRRGVAPINADGSYSMKCPPGKSKVAVVTRTITGDDVAGPNRPAVREFVLPPRLGSGKTGLSPKKYESFETTPLEFDVTSGANSIDIKLD